MTVRHPERTPMPKSPEISGHNHEKVGSRPWYYRVVALVGGAALVGGVGIGIDKAASHKADIRPPQATSAPLDTHSATTGPTATSEAPTKSTINTPSNILDGKPFAELSPAAQADLRALDSMPVNVFEKQSESERAFYSKEFYETYGPETEAQLAQYDAGGDNTRLIPVPSTLGQRIASKFSAAYDAGFVSLEVNGNPNILSDDLARRAQAEKNAAGLSYSVDDVTYGNTYSYMKTAILETKSFSPSPAAEGNYTAPLIVERQSPLVKADDPAMYPSIGYPSIAVDNGLAGTPGELQDFYVEVPAAHGGQVFQRVSELLASDPMAEHPKNQDIHAPIDEGW